MRRYQWEVSDERHPDDRHDASNVTFASVGVERTSPSRQLHSPNVTPNVTLTTAWDHRPSTVSTRTTVPSPKFRSRFWAFCGPGSASTPGRQQATAGMAHCLRLTTPPAAVEHDCKGPAAGVGAPNTPAPAPGRLSGRSGRLWRTAGLTNPTAAHWRSRVERSHLN
jgi:hypothetical protein